MSNGSTHDSKAVWVGVLCALGGFLTLLGAFFYVIRSYVTQGAGAVTQGGGAVVWWQALGMLAFSVIIAFSVAAMLRFALSPLVNQTQSAAAAATSPDASTALRSRIAITILMIGSIAIVVLAVALIIAFSVLAWLGPFPQLQPKMDTLLTGVFMTVLPVLATWVGTVLAFYFGSENFRQAAQSTREALSERLAQTRKITDAMIPYEKIAKLDADDETAAAQRKMRDVVHTMSEAATRVIIFNTKKQSPIYIIRSNTPPMPANWITADYQEGTELKDNLIQDYLTADGGKQGRRPEFPLYQRRCNPRGSPCADGKRGCRRSVHYKGRSKDEPSPWVGRNA
jgi:hypothetical protein